MKKIVLTIALVSGFGAIVSYGQIQKGNVLVGANLANIDISLEEGGNFGFGIEPKAAWFIKDNQAVGAYVKFDLTTAKDAGASINYGVGAFGRYYINDQNLNLARHSRFFIEANAGIEGFNPATGDNTNGLGLGIGPGVAYFVTPNVGLEGLVKFNTIIGFGQALSSSSLNFGLGFQIYLPGRSIRRAVEDVK